MRIRTNNIPRETVCYWDIPAKDQELFDYIVAGDTRETWDYRLFRYRGEHYDYCQFDYVNPEYPAYRELYALGWHGVQSQSAFDAVVIKYCADDETIIVGHATW